MEKMEQNEISSIFLYPLEHQLTPYFTAFCQHWQEQNLPLLGNIPHQQYRFQPMLFYFMTWGI